MNFAIAIDRNFIMQACTLLKSIELTQKNFACVYILHDDLTDEDKTIILSQFNKEKIEIIFLYVKLDNFNFHTSNKVHLSKATYFRLYLHKLLPNTIDRILYLDCDMVVLDDLLSLYNTDFNGKPCSVVIDMFSDDREIYQRLDYLEYSGYFNAGMILINLPVWTKEEISEKALAFIKDYPEKCIAHDQDALNKALSGNFIFASTRYNMQLDFFCDLSNLIVDSKYFDDIIASRKNPCVIHFTGPTKPWLANCKHPYMQLWDYFQNKTKWKNKRKKNEYKGIELLKYLIKQPLIKMHLYKDKDKDKFLSETFSQANDILKALN